VDCRDKPGNDDEGGECDAIGGLAFHVNPPKLPTSLGFRLETGK
jgi:hypothetical protein